MNNDKIPLSDKAVEYVLTRKLNELKRLTADSIASAVQVNLSFLLREFEQDQDISLDDFLVREKIHTAIFLIEKDREITDDQLASRLGFTSVNQFIDAFESYIFVTPDKYRTFIYP
jgi:AraC-like DNA-binding protein